MADNDKDAELLKRAKDRFRRCQEWESEFRKLYVQDMRFGNADADNGWQWPDSVRRNREFDDRPCLTINKTKQHCLQIINDGKQNKPAVHIHPIDSGATVEAAKLLDGIVRHIEYNSDAQVAYDTATEQQVFGGIGYWRVVTEYASEDSFDQEIFIRRIKDALTVYKDPDIKEADGSDSKFDFVFEDITKDAFEAKYGKELAEQIGFPMGELGGDEWLQPDHIRVCEYFEREPESDEIAALPADFIQHMPQNLRGQLRNGNSVYKSQIHPEHWNALDGVTGIRKRTVEKMAVKWYMIAGDKIIDRGEWAGKYIPIVRVVGEETVIDGKLERKGHVRQLKDPQRMYNYWTSSATEAVALQGKQPYIAPARAIAGYEKYWETANTENYSYLPYNDVDEDNPNVPVAAPQRQQPPTMPQAYIQGMQTAANEMMMVSGQYQAVMGAQSNETSGIAINARQRQGDNATYHYIDNLARGIRFTGRILLDLIPKIYDTERVMRILGEDGVEDFIHLNPQAPNALMQQKVGMRNEVKQILNPKIGRYDVVVDVGPSYSTRRQEAFENLSKLMMGDPDLMAKCGDLLFKAADFPMAQDVAERLNRAVPPSLLGHGPTPHEQQLMAQVQNLSQALGKMSQTLAKEKDKSGTEHGHVAIDAYKAETDRIKALGIPPAELEQIIHQLVRDALQTNIIAPGALGQLQPPPPIQPNAAGPQPTQQQPQGPQNAGFALSGPPNQ